MLEDDLIQLRWDDEIRFENYFGNLGDPIDNRPLDADEQARFNAFFGNFQPGEPAYRLRWDDEMRFYNYFGKGFEEKPVYGFPVSSAYWIPDYSTRKRILATIGDTLAQIQRIKTTRSAASSGNDQWMKPIRKGEPRALTYPLSCKASIESLAELIGFDADDALGENGWLRDGDGKQISEFKPCILKSFSVPNRVVVCAGNDKSDEDATIAFRKSAEEFASGLQGDGIDVIHLKTWGDTADKFQNVANDINTFGWVFFGHGEESSPVLAHELRVLLELNDKVIEQKARLEKEVIRKKAEIAKLKHTQAVIGNKFEKMLKTAEIKSDELSRPFKFSYLLLFECSVNSTGAWDKLHSKGAVSYLPQNQIYAISGNGMEGVSYMNFRPKGL